VCGGCRVGSGGFLSALYVTVMFTARGRYGFRWCCLPIFRSMYDVLFQESIGVQVAFPIRPPPSPVSIRKRLLNPNAMLNHAKMEPPL
jgi:hypothetical protein